MKPLLNTTLLWLKTHWRLLISLIIITALAAFTLSLQINSLMPGQNSFETAALANFEKFPNPLYRAVNAPYNLIAFTAAKILGNPLLGARLTSVLFGILAAVCFFYLLKLWFNLRTAAVGTSLFITGSWMLNFSHQAAPITILIFAPLLALLAFTLAAKADSNKHWALIAFAASLALAAYIPYTPWVLIAALVVFIVKERQLILKMPLKTIIIAAAVYFVLLTPLFIALAHHPGQIKELFGFPANLPSFGIYFSQLGNLLLALVIRAPFMPAIHLGSLPMLDIFSAAMFFLGLYYFVKRLPKMHSLILLSCFILLLLVLPLTSDYQYGSAILLPIIYIFVTMGIIKMLKLWYQYFPRNPLARNMGVALLIAAIAFSCYYNLRTYFIAWPSSPDTKAVYVVNTSPAKISSNR